MIIGVQSGAFVGAITLALAFGLIYAALTHWMRKEGHLRGHTSYQVMWGVLATLLINKLIHSANPIEDFILELTTFAGTGLPMIIEHQVTFWLENKAAQADEDARIEEQLQREVHHGN